MKGRTRIHRSRSVVRRVREIRESLRDDIRVSGSTQNEMTNKRTGFDAVRRMALALPGVQEGTAYGSPALKVNGKMFACLASHKSAEPNTLVVLIDFGQRDDLIAEEPATYYLTDHYVDYPCVLVRLSCIWKDSLRDLLLMGWRVTSTAKRQAARKRGRTHGISLLAPGS